MGQLGADLADAEDRSIGQALIEALDEGGYLTLEPAEIAGRLGLEVRRVERVLKRLQEFDPPGVFARSLAECLGLQLADLLFQLLVLEFELADAGFQAPDHCLPGGERTGLGAADRDEDRQDEPEGDPDDDGGSAFFDQDRY